MEVHNQRSLRMSNKVFFIPCEIERGGFTSERTFEISVDNGKLIGTANVEYLRTEGRKPLGEDTPGYGEKIRGFVACRKVREENDGVLAEVPSSDMIHVLTKDLLDFADYHSSHQ
jgi:hypothetical protein